MPLTDKLFGKSHKLCNKTLLDTLFEKGISLFSYPFKCVYFVTEQADNAENVQVMISVSKRNHKKAVARNLLKRRIREAYRLNKSLWILDDTISRELFSGNKRIVVSFIYTSKDILDYKIIKNGIRKGIRTIYKSIKENNGISTPTVN